MTTVTRSQTPAARGAAFGAPVSGPTTAPQPCFETRTEPDGVLAVRLPGAG
ncbi:hypothetical protein [Streptomyces sp900105755]|uniref:Uncharacterized protein n=1 Tax=Streptomyces sp. 900105755 TaxID=3154389 RepID=A0ABV1T9I4_9ACTN